MVSTEVRDDSGTPSVVLPAVFLPFVSISLLKIVLRSGRIRKSDGSFLHDVFEIMMFFEPCAAHIEMNSDPRARQWLLTNARKVTVSVLYWYEKLPSLYATNF